MLMLCRAYGHSSDSFANVNLSGARPMPYLDRTVMMRSLSYSANSMRPLPRARSRQTCKMLCALLAHARMPGAKTQNAVSSQASFCMHMLSTSLATTLLPVLQLLPLSVRPLRRTKIKVTSRNMLHTLPRKTKKRPYNLRRHPRFAAFN